MPPWHSNSEKIVEFESRTSSIEQDLQCLDPTSAQNHSAMEVLREKLDDLENREQRNNLQFVGIPESISPDALPAYLSINLPKALNLQLPPDPLLFERAHHLGPPKEQRGGRP